MRYICLYISVLKGVLEKKDSGQSNNGAAPKHSSYIFSHLALNSFSVDRRGRRCWIVRNSKGYFFFLGHPLDFRHGWTNREGSKNDRSILFFLVENKHTTSLISFFLLNFTLRELSIFSPP